MDRVPEYFFRFFWFVVGEKQIPQLLLLSQRLYIPHKALVVLLLHMYFSSPRPMCSITMLPLSRNVSWGREASGSEAGRSGSPGAQQLG